jgi:ComF family protein
MLSPDDPLYRKTAGRLAEEGSLSGFVACFAFEKDGALQTLIHQLKYGGMTAIGVELGRVLARRIPDLLGSLDGAGIVPVPLHRARLRERGYNQSDEISRGVSGVTGFPVYRNLLRRVHNTTSQTTLSLEERRLNVAGAFVISRPALSHVRQRTFLIVDDVVTTGSTICECSKALLEACADRTIACSIALAS